VKRVAPAIEFTAAAPKDIPAIAALLREADLPHEDFADHLEHFLVARHGDEIVGAVGFELHGADALLRSLVVAPRRRGEGLGGRLVEQLTTSALAHGVKRFYLLTMTAEAFFAKRGFRKTARGSVPADIAGTKEFNSLCPVSAVCMTRTLKTTRQP
jgi:amino-acid N-acetyltransferase